MIVLEFAFYASFSAAVAALLAYLFDRYEKEYIFYLWLAMAAGMLSCLIPVVLQALFPFLFIRITPSLTSKILSSLVSAAGVEELSKLAVFAFLLSRLPSVNEFYDVMLYFSMVGAGFGTFENFLYIVNTVFATAERGASVEAIREVARRVALLRVTPAHFLFDFIAGYFIAHAVFGRKKYFWAAGAAAGILLHFTFNLLALTGLLREWFGFIAFMVLAAYVLGKDALRRSPFAPSAEGKALPEKGKRKEGIGLFLLLLLLLLLAVLLTFLALIVLKGILQALR